MRDGSLSPEASDGPFSSEDADDDEWIAESIDLYDHLSVYELDYPTSTLEWCSMNDSGATKNDALHPLTAWKHDILHTISTEMKFIACASNRPTGYQELQVSFWISKPTFAFPNLNSKCASS